MKKHKIITRRRGVSIIEVTIALAIIMLVSAATTALILRASKVEGEVAHAIARDQHIENIIECYQWAHGDTAKFAAAMGALGYQDSVTLTPPTCLGQGEITCTCSECGGFSLNIEPVGHRYGTAVVTHPTCEEAGYTTHSCACGDSYLDPDSNVPALGHKDENKDHICDNKCEVYQGTHADSDTDNDHVCDYGCGEVLEECSDVTTDNDHNCDVCGKEGITTCVDDNTDSTCDVCSGAMPAVVPAVEPAVSGEDEE